MAPKYTGEKSTHDKNIEVLVSDGAEWIWNLADQHFPGAIQIVDLYHARQHPWDVARKL